MFTTEDRRLAESIAALAYANPFLEQRIAHEKEILGEAWIPGPPYWSLLPERGRSSNIDRIAERCNALMQRLQAGGAKPSRSEAVLYEEVAVYFLYERYREAIFELFESDPSQRVAFYPRFKADCLAHLPGADAAHLFACFFQVVRAFQHIFHAIIGRSQAAARLRAAVWQSVFTHDMRRYRRSLYARMGDVATLITGPTGTGKELVARAIGLSRYVPFDERRERFVGDPATTFHGVNLSALSPTLLESELFGHRKGSFTGALADREGFLESCGALGTVFLDEIGEVDPAVQVKLLRVIQTRTFQRLGDTTTRRFEGKLIAATNRNLLAEIRGGTFREDFYYRLCADTITTPSLGELLANTADELPHLIRFVAARVAGAGEAEQLADEVLRAIRVSPGLDYPWPGNFRELEQCVRSVMLRGEYRAGETTRGDARQRIAGAIVNGTLNADDLLRNYCTLLYAKTRNYSQVAEQLGIDRRTVRAKVDPVLLEEL
ncbi:MAG TPA: sigma 54-interacting transcriptional regulator [Thermoanaerobaculia bacterium]